MIPKKFWNLIIFFVTILLLYLVINFFPSGSPGKIRIGAFMIALFVIEIFVFIIFIIRRIVGKYWTEQRSIKYRLIIKKFTGILLIISVFSPVLSILFLANFSYNNKYDQRAVFLLPTIEVILFIISTTMLVIAIKDGSSKKGMLIASTIINCLLAWFFCWITIFAALFTGDLYSGLG